MNYRHVYMLIIEHAKSEEKLGIRSKGNGSYYEKHHILPKSIFPLWNKRKGNLVLLTAREHFFCHQLLTKIFPCQETFCSVYMLATTNQSKTLKVTSKEYERLKVERAKYCGDWVRKALKGRRLDDYYNADYVTWKKERCSCGAKNRSIESLKRMSSKLSKALKGRVSPTKGRKWFNNGKEQAMLYECPDGWVRGRLDESWCKGKHLPDSTKQKLSNGRRGRHRYTDGTTIKILYPEDVPDGWYLVNTRKEV